MTNRPNDKQHNLVTFLRHNKPNPPKTNKDLEQLIMNSLEPQLSKGNFNYRELAKTIAQEIGSSTPFKLFVTGFLFTSISFFLKTPRIAIEPKDLENFLVKNWHDTLQKNSYTNPKGTEAYWLLPATEESSSSFSASAQ